MIKGMTGFGFSQFSVGSIKIVLEIKSVNHRYLDLNVYVPAGFGAIEDRIRQIVQKQISRGRVTVAFKFMGKPDQSFGFNKAAVRQYQKHAHSLKKDFNLKGDLSIAEMIRLPGVVEVSETTLDPEVMRPAIEKNVLKALKSMEQMREREGRSLFLDLGRQLASMKAEARKIEQRARAILKEKKKTLSMEEMASFQKSNDINEEIARLLHYVDEFKKFLKTSQPTGKKLDFIAQEMQRETNTIGSKVQDKVVSGAVITLKSKIEKIREQAQNIE